MANGGSAMSKFTKAAIMQSFMKLLNETPFDKITIKDIVADCGINRNTFYYNFKDIYALVDEILQNEVNKISVLHLARVSWNERLLTAANFALQNKRAVFHLHNSAKRDQLKRYFEKVVYGVIHEYVESEAKGFDISEHDIEFIAGFYCFALMGLLEKWLDGGMKEDINEIIAKAGKLFDVNIKHAIRIINKN